MDGGNGGGFCGEEWLHQVVVGGKREGKGSCYKRRFNDDQIRSLETMFEEETKLEPRKKVQLAKELGLQPRQVAIWFQNRRARWKSKQLEREYNVLKANFDGLAQRLDSLELEKQSLIKQVNKLKELLEKGGVEGQTNEDDSKVVRVAPISEEADTKPQVAIGEGADHITRLNLSSNEENSNKCIERFGPEESDLMSIIEPADPATTNERSGPWPEEWGVDLDSGSFSDQSCCTMEWWDFWV